MFGAIAWMFYERGHEPPPKPEPLPPTPYQICQGHKGIRVVSGDGYGSLYVTCNDNTWKKTEEQR
jgi:hypothetical protein